MSTLERFIKHLVLPVVIAGVVVIAIRFVWLAKYGSENVDPGTDVPIPSLQEDYAGVDFENEVKDQLGEDVRQAKGTIRGSLDQDRELSEEQQSQLASLEEELDQQIEELSTTNGETWATKRDAVLSKLEEYAKYVSSIREA